MSIWSIGLAGMTMLAVAWAQPPAPVVLTVASATRAQVDLSWTAATGAASYSVQRKAGGDYATIATPTASPYADKSIDPYTTYAYRILAVNPSGASAGSNEWTVGPPAFGFTVVAPSPAGLENPNLFGRLVRLALDPNGDPALAYVHADPDGDGDEKDNTLYFISWNRVLYTWNAPVKVAVTGAANAGGRLVPVTLGRDASSNLWALVYAVQDSAGSRLDFATSTDGANWTVQTVSTRDTSNALTQPSLAIADGRVYLAYASGEGLQYVTGKTTDGPSKWTTVPVPLPGGYTRTFDAVSLALDAAGTPGMAYLVSSESNSAAAFWRPAGGGGAVIIGDNNGHGNDGPDITLTFFGTEPRVAMDAVHDDQYNGTWDHSIWVSRGDGGGWTSFVNLPSDGETSLLGPLSIAVGSQGQTAIAISTNGGVYGTNRCGYPKIARAAGFTAFETCAPTLAGNPEFGQVVWPVVKFGGNDKLWAVFQLPDPYSQIGTGVMLWREP
jgi:hypothetical protein